MSRGHQVTVYCRERPPGNVYRGVRRQYLPTFRHKYFDTLTHTALSTLHLLFHRFDAALYCNGANAVFTILPRLFGIPVMLNVDGLERKRKKWNRLARTWYLISEWLATFFPTVVVSDARSIADYYRQRYGKSTVYIAYGAETGKVESTAAIRSLGLDPGRYFLYVSRMEPENNALEVRQAFEKVRTDFKLALIGDAPYAEDYIRRVRDTADPRIIMPGAVYGQGYRELGSHCFAYIHATEVGGTHPALLEAMGRGVLVLYLDNPESAEAAEGAGIPFADDLAAKIQLALEMGEEQANELRRRAVERVRERYDWEAVTNQYERLFLSLRRS